MSQLPTFDFRDAQNCCKQGQNLIHLFNGAGDYGTPFGAGFYRLLTRIQLVPQPCQRGAQIMGDIARHLPQIVEQAFITLQHCIE